MKGDEMWAWAEDHGEPFPDHEGRLQYRCAATLRDGTELPCVLLARRERQVDLFLRREADTRGRPDRRDVMSTFVTAGNRVNDYDIAGLAPSAFAIPYELLRQVKGETSMSWTQFQIEMNDGKRFHFGTTWIMEFFDLPAGYSTERMKRVISAPLGAPRPDDTIYRERLFFTCYV